VCVPCQTTPLNLIIPRSLPPSAFQSAAKLTEANRKLEEAASELMRHHALQGKMIALEAQLQQVAKERDQANSTLMEAKVPPCPRLSTCPRYLQLLNPTTDPKLGTAKISKLCEPANNTLASTNTLTGPSPPAI